MHGHAGKNEENRSKTVYNNNDANVCGIYKTCKSKIYDNNITKIRKC